MFGFSQTFHDRKRAIYLSLNEIIWFRSPIPSKRVALPTHFNKMFEDYFHSAKLIFLAMKQMTLEWNPISFNWNLLTSLNWFSLIIMRACVAVSFQFSLLLQLLVTQTKKFRNEVATVRFSLMRARKIVKLCKLDGLPNYDKSIDPWNFRPIECLVRQKKEGKER